MLPPPGDLTGLGIAVSVGTSRGLVATRAGIANARDAIDLVAASPALAQCPGAHDAHVVGTAAGGASAQVIPRGCQSVIGPRTLAVAVGIAGEALQSFESAARLFSAQLHGIDVASAFSG